MRYGAGRDSPVTMWVTALHCSSLVSSSRLNHLWEQRLHCWSPIASISQTLPPCRAGHSLGLEGAWEEGLVAGGRGEEEAEQAVAHGQECSPMLDLQWQPAEGEGHIKLQVFHKLPLQPRKEWHEQCMDTLPCPPGPFQPTPGISGTRHHSLGGESQPDLLQFHAVHVALVLHERGVVPLAAQVGKEVIPSQQGRAVLGHARNLCQRASVMPGTRESGGCALPALTPLRTSRTSSPLSCTMVTSCMS